MWWWIWRARVWRRRIGRMVEWVVRAVSVRRPLRRRVNCVVRERMQRVEGAAVIARRAAQRGDRLDRVRGRVVQVL